MNIKDRYWLFAGDNFYPAGGMNDFRGSYESCLDAVLNLGRCDWWDVLDTKTGRVYQSRDVNHMNGHQLKEWAAGIDNDEGNECRMKVVSSHLDQVDWKCDLCGLNATTTHPDHPECGKT